MRDGIFLLLNTNMRKYPVRELCSSTLIWLNKAQVQIVALFVLTEILYSLYMGDWGADTDKHNFILKSHFMYFIHILCTSCFTIQYQKDYFEKKIVIFKLIFY